jgi:AraC-like DNA-binding protein
MTVRRMLGRHPPPANDQSGMRLTLVATPGSIRGAWGYAWLTMSSPALRTERALSILAVADLVAWRQQQGESLITMLEGTGIPPEALATEAALYTHALGAPVQFGTPLTQLQIDPRQLDTPLPDANALLVQMLQPQCEAREAQVLPTHTVSWTQRVRDALARHPDGTPWPDADAVAQGLRCSKRTLRRQLALEGAHFQALSDAERSQRARQWLEGSTHELHTVATALGYSEPAALIRAYKRWFGVTPRGRP